MAMRKTIERVILITTVRSAKVNAVNDRIETVNNADITVYGKITQDEALKVVKKKFGKNNAYVIRGISSVENEYQIRIEDFVKNATLIKTTGHDRDLK